MKMIIMKTISTKVNFLSQFSFTSIHFSQYSRGRISTCWTITADSSPLHKASDWTQTKNPKKKEKIG